MVKTARTTKAMKGHRALRTVKVTKKKMTSRKKTVEKEMVASKSGSRKRAYGLMRAFVSTLGKGPSCLAIDELLFEPLIDVGGSEVLHDLLNGFHDLL